LLKFPFKYKYLKQDIVLEVAICINNAHHRNSLKKRGGSLIKHDNGIRNAETLLYKAAFSFEDILLNQNRWIEPYLHLHSSSDEN